MNADAIDEAFADLDNRYPGSRHARRPVVQEPPAIEPTIWDSHPYSKIMGGKPVEMFAIGALAKALDRPLVTIRLWTRQGHLPQATYRLPARQVPTFDAAGKFTGNKEQAGRRLYTRAQIEAVIEIATAHGILHARRIEWSEHPRFGVEIAYAWEKLQGSKQ